MYAYPAGHRMAEHIFYSLERPSVLRTVALSEYSVQTEIGAHVILGDTAVARYRIRTRCGQARVLVTLSRHGHLVSVFDLVDTDPRLAADVTFDPADMEAYFAPLGTL